MLTDSTRCTNQACGATSVTPIHRSQQKVAIDATDGAQTYSLHVTYRCSECGHTWATWGFASETAIEQAGAGGQAAPSKGETPRGW